MFIGQDFLNIAPRFSGVASELWESLRGFFDLDETVRGCDCDGCCCDEGPVVPVHAGSELGSCLGNES